MARGRMLNTTIATDNRLAKLSLEAEYLYLKTIPHLDRDGLILGDATVLWARACPRRLDLLPVTESLVGQWRALNLVIDYDSPEGQILFFPSFGPNQAGLRYDREPASAFPPPPGYVRTSTGLVPAVRQPSVGDPPANIRQASGEHPAGIPQIAALTTTGSEQQQEQQGEVEQQQQLGVPAARNNGSAPKIDVVGVVDSQKPLLQLAAKEFLLSVTGNFQGADAFVAHYDPHLIGQWCAYVASLAGTQADRIESAAGFIHSKCREHRPPQLSGAQTALWEAWIEKAHALYKKA